MDSRLERWRQDLRYVKPARQGDRTRFDHYGMTLLEIDLRRSLPTDGTLTWDLNPDLGVQRRRDHEPVLVVTVSTAGAAAEWRIYTGQVARTIEKGPRL